jgi:hypothetical protein
MAVAPPPRAPGALSGSWRRPAALASVRRGGGLDGFELALLVAFGAFSLWMIGVDVVTAAAHHRAWSGTDGLYLPDQLQYTAWIRDASKHVLVSDLFVLNGTPHDYLQPAIAISGGLTALGVAPWVSLLLWKPVAVLAVFFAVRAFCRRTLSDRTAQRVALVLAIFYGSVGTYPAIDESLPFLSWGYPFTLLATAAMVGALLDYARARGQARLTWAAPLLGLLASWLHPWQGEILILVILGGEALSLNRSSAGRSLIPLLALTVAATALPLVYYGALDHFDPVWRLGRVATLADHWDLGKVLLPLIPIAAAAALAYRKRPQGFLQAATRVWPFAALVVFELSQHLFAATPLHALTGVTIPLAVLAVQGALSLSWPRRLPAAHLLVWLAVAAATIPETAHLMDLVRSKQVSERNGMNFVNHSEQRALDYLRHDPRAGGVITDYILGAVVPGDTGRRTYIGNCDWSVPHCSWRWDNTWRIFLWSWAWRYPHGWYVRWVVHRSGARFVLASCHSHVPHFARQLGSLLVGVHRFGCASVYEVRPGQRYLI